ncbi:hypothetical protein SETIT_8G082800v2 [Setaria italica]|uniref:Uncharacterized protein n=1 Tax=Setaria italica TaxID=4555 RepID=A0A368S5H2_SETIT|nr:hypothetical protein SETIT_8G082800v2 [Setaria italica]
MKKPSTLLRSFSSRLSTRLLPSPAVAPWPPVRSAYDRWLAAELDELRADPLAPCTSAAWLARALTLAGAGIDRKTIDECIEDAAELLDACAALRDRLDALRSYATATRVALHWLEGHGAEAAARRAADAFAECEAVERRCGRGAELAKCGSNLCKLGERAVQSSRTPLACGHRRRCPAFTFPPRRAVSGVANRAAGGKAVAKWECALQEVQRHVREEYDRRRKDGVPCMSELDAAAAAVRAAKCAVAGGRRCPETVMEAASRRCDELEETVAAFEKVGELQRVDRCYDCALGVGSESQRSRAA